LALPPVRLEEGAESVAGNEAVVPAHQNSYERAYEDFHDRFARSSGCWVRRVTAQWQFTQPDSAIEMQEPGDAAGTLGVQFKA
jgi:hypothetical protein